jgi:phosphoesterase RecJ-like protein
MKKEMESKNNVTLEKVFSLLCASPSWVILTHQKPDGDAVGSASSLAAYGMENGKKIRWGGGNPLPPTYSFLPLSGTYEVFNRAEDLLPLSKDTLIISLDTSNIERSIPELEKIHNDAQIINIDHHGDNTLYGDYNYIDENASSLGEILWHMFHLCNASYSCNSAIGLYTAIVTDSGKFSFSSTSPRTHEAAAELIKKGVLPAEISHKIFYNQPIESMKLWGKAFERVELAGHSKISISWLTLEDFLQLNSSPADTEGLVNELLRVKDVEFAILLVEEEDQIRISLRSRGVISARDIAHRFEGGGHMQAAGCRIEAPLSQAIQIITKAVEEAMQ